MEIFLKYNDTTLIWLARKLREKQREVQRASEPGVVEERKEVWFR
jgi:hypothetical protein